MGQWALVSRSYLYAGIGDRRGGKIGIVGQIG
jgi:hypothetical protein